MGTVRMCLHCPDTTKKSVWKNIEMGKKPTSERVPKIDASADEAITSVTTTNTSSTATKLPTEVKSKLKKTSVPYVTWKEGIRQAKILEIWRETKCFFVPL